MFKDEGWFDVAEGGHGAAIEDKHGAHAEVLGEAHVGVDAVAGKINNSHSGSEKDSVMTAHPPMRAH